MHQKTIENGKTMEAKHIMKTLIKEYGGTQKVFASMIGVSQPTVASWMAQECLPSSGIAKIMKALPEVSFDFLSGKSNNMSNGSEGNISLPGVNYYPNLPATAGQVPVGDYDGSTEKIYIPGMNAEAYMPVKGNSMNPTLQSGDIVGIHAVQDIARIRPNEIYMVFTTDNERMLKRIVNIDEGEWLTLHSDNPDYKPFRVLKEQVCAVYRVVCFIRSME